MSDTPRTAPISEDVDEIFAADEAKKKAAAAEAAKPNPTGFRDVTDTEAGKLLGDREQMQEKVDRATDRWRSAQEQINRQQAQGRVKRATENMRSAQEMIDAMKKAEQRSFGSRYDAIEAGGRKGDQRGTKPPKKKTEE